jgi:excisionase family DNA binding protein
MSMTPHEIDTLADALADRVASRLSGRSDTHALVDSHAAAALLGCSVPTVERLTKTGEIPSMKIGRLRRYRRSDLIGRQNEKGGCDHA